MSDQTRLNELRSLFEANAFSRTRREWLRRAVEDEGFYDGTAHWTDMEREQITESLGISPVTVNKLKARIDNVSGMEIQSRTKVVYAARSVDEEDALRAEALSHIAMWIEDKNDSTYLLSSVSHDSYKVGIGVHGFDVQNGKVAEMVISPFEYVWDVSDRSNDLSFQRLGAIPRWFKRERLRQMFKKKAEEIDGMIAGNGVAFASVYDLEPDTRLCRSGGYWDKDNDELLVVQMQYAKPEKFYSVIRTVNGKAAIFHTFDKKEAEKLADDKKTIEELNGWRVYQAFFTGSVLFQDAPYAYQLDPENGLLMYTPFVQNMTSPANASPGVPYSNLCMAKDAQRLYNKTRTRLAWLMSSRQVIMEGQAAEAETVRTEAARADGVLAVKSGAKLTINAHEAQIAQHVAAASGYDKDIQDALGIYDEALGMETNAQSGIAIQKRQVGASRNQALVLDRFRAMKKRWAFKLLRLIQCVVTEPQVFYVTDDQGMTQAIAVNGGDSRIVLDGKEVVAPDIKVGAFDVTVQEVPDYASMKDISRENVLKAAQAVGGFGALTPDILKFFGVPPSDEMVKASEAGAHAQAAAANAQGQQVQNIEGGMTPTTAPAAGAPILG